MTTNSVYELAHYFRMPFYKCDFSDKGWSIIYTARANAEYDLRLLVINTDS